MKVTAVAMAFLCLTLAGCSDSTGAIDDAGHNGFDQSTCTDLKAMALDVQYQAVTAAQGRTRATAINVEAARAGDPAVRSAATSYIAAYVSGNQQTLTASVAQLVKVCRF